MNVDIGTVRNSCNFDGEMSNVFSSCKTAWIFFFDFTFMHAGSAMHEIILSE